MTQKILNGQLVDLTPEEQAEYDARVAEHNSPEALAQKALKVVQDKRRGEYPPADQLFDAEVKIASGDPVLVTEGEAQKQAYVDACLAVKANNPKPE